MLVERHETNPHCPQSAVESRARARLHKKWRRQNEKKKKKIRWLENKEAEKGSSKKRRMLNQNNRFSFDILTCLYSYVDKEHQKWDVHEQP